MASLAASHAAPEHALLVIDSGESKRTVEAPDFDLEAYEEDRLLLINQGMKAIARKDSDAKA